MSRLVLEPTDMAQWQRLLAEASYSRGITLSEDIESYLVFMLMRFVKNPWAPSRVVTADFYETLQMTGQLERLQLQDVADRCVLMAGLFPEHAKKRFVSVKFCVELARTGYDSVATLLHKRGYQVMYQELTQHVVDMVTTLSSTRNLDAVNDILPQEIATALEESLRTNVQLQ